MKNFFLLLLILLLSSCSTMTPPRYSVSVDNIQKLKEFKGSQVSVDSLEQAATFNANCRLMGPIEPADNLTIPQFVSKAINDEFKMADIHSTSGTKLTGDITRIDFSSVSGLTNGFWDIEIQLSSSNGKSLTSSNKYTFKSGFDAITACNATADALAPAVQDLINTIINDPAFEELIK